MSDEADQASDREQSARDAAQEAIRIAAAAIDINGTGTCLNCGEPVKPGRWCDIECRSDWMARGENK